MVIEHSTNPQLLGTIKLNNMLPVPTSEIIPYDLDNEQDINYKNLVINELDWIQQNTTKIIKSAKRIYRLKIGESTIKNGCNTKFFDSIMPYIDAEAKCNEYQKKGS